MTDLESLLCLLGIFTAGLYIGYNLAKRKVSEEYTVLIDQACEMLGTDNHKY